MLNCEHTRGNVQLVLIFVIALCSWGLGVHNIKCVEIYIINVKNVTQKS